MLQHEGVFEGGAATIDWFVVPGSGTGELKRLRATGNIAAGHAEPHPFTMDFDVD